MCIVPLKALGSETLGLTCTRLSFADTASSLKLLAASLLGDIVTCSYAVAEKEVHLHSPSQSVMESEVYTALNRNPSVAVMLLV